VAGSAERTQAGEPLPDLRAPVILQGAANGSPSPHDLKILTREEKQKNPLTLTLRDA
jgi:hypothetical protein